MARGKVTGRESKRERGRKRERKRMEEREKMPLRCHFAGISKFCPLSLALKVGHCHRLRLFRPQLNIPINQGEGWTLVLSEWKTHRLGTLYG